MEQFMKLVEGFVDMVADKVLVKLWETQRMKDFLANKDPTSSIDVDQIEGLSRFIKNAVNDCLDSQSRRVEADDVDGLELYVENIVEDTIKNRVTVSIDI